MKKNDVVKPRSKGEKVRDAAEVKGAARKSANAQIGNSAMPAPKKRIPLVNNSNS